MKESYAVTATRDGEWWALVCEQPLVASQAKRLDQADEMIREALAIVLDVPGDSFDVEIKPVLPSPWREHVDSIIRFREAIQRMNAVLQLEQQQAITELVEEGGLPYRDVGHLLDLSHQRVSQIIKAAPEKVRIKMSPEKVQRGASEVARRLISDAEVFEAYRKRLDELAGSIVTVVPSDDLIKDDDLRPTHA